MYLFDLAILRNNDGYSHAAISLNIKILLFKEAKAIYSLYLLLLADKF